MVKYHANRSPRTLETVTDPLRGYPAHWEIMRWYRCWRKFPYQSEVHAAIIAEARGGEYGHFPCTVDSNHWHVGRGGNKADPRKLLQRAKRVYRRSVRDEIWAEYEEKKAREAKEESTDA